jgi:hypothetical protein
MRFSARAPVLAVLAVLTVFALIAAVVIAMLLLTPSDEQRALAPPIGQAPGFDLAYPAGKLIEVDDSNAVLGASAYRVRGYGTDTEQAEILGYFDTELAKLGYHQTPPTPNSMTRFQRDQPLRQYQSGAYTFRLYLLGVPYRLSRNVTITGYQHVLFTALSN